MGNQLNGSQSINHNYINMKKKFRLEDGSLTELGDVLYLNSENSFWCGTIDNNSIPWLLKMGVITEVNEEEPKEEPKKELEIELFDVINHLAKRLKWNVHNVCKYLDTITEIHPAAGFSILLKEVALMLDSKYPDNIRNCKEIWTISSVTGNFVLLDTKAKKHFKNFAAFRSLDDAKKAASILKNEMNELFGREQKN